jgi:deoxycytidine triphosphate deaminase
VRLDAIIVVVRDKNASLFFDPVEHSIQDFWEEIGQEIDLRKRRTEPFADSSGKRRRRAGYWLAPGEICLAFTHEHVSLPIQGEQVLQGEIWNRSRTARAFVHTHISAPHIKPGTDNKITLEIKNDGPFYVRLTYLEPIAQIGFEEVQGAVRQTKSTFHGQKRPSGKQN